MENTLTVSQALAEGYTDYVYSNDGFQSLKDIKDGEMDFSRSDIHLIEKESYHPDGLDAKQIAELLADHINANHVDDSGDGTDRVFDAINALDFSDVSERIQAELNKMNYYRATKIRLIPD